MLNSKLIIYASNVRSYGGATLVQAMVDKSNDDCFFIINSDLDLQRYPKYYIRKSGNIASMFLYEYRLKTQTNESSAVLCLANRPLFFKQKAFVVTFLASVFAIEIPENIPLSFSRRIKSRLQIFLNVTLRYNTDMFLARSQEMVDKCRETTGWRTEYFPFLPRAINIKRTFNSPRVQLRNATLFYPSDASPHKNHQKLFKAWEILSASEIPVKLIVTISPDQAKKFNKKYKQLNIHPVGFLGEQELNDQYRSADALMFPSLLESFPLALIEARSFKLPILACEKRFIREHVDPEESFDPMCEHSIAAAVTRFVKPQELFISRPNTADLFDYIWKSKQDSDKATTKLDTQ